MGNLQACTGMGLPQPRRGEVLHDKGSEQVWGSARSGSMERMLMHVYASRKAVTTFAALHVANNRLDWVARHTDVPWHAVPCPVM